MFQVTTSFVPAQVRVQTMPKPKPGEIPQFTGVFDCFRKTVAKEGFFALYKGMAAPLVGVSPLFAIYFLGCSVGKKLQQTSPDQKLTYGSRIFAFERALILQHIAIFQRGRVGGRVHHRHHGTWRANQVPAAGQLLVILKRHPRCFFAGTNGGKRFTKVFRSDGRGAATVQRGWHSIDLSRHIRHTGT